MRGKNPNEIQYAPETFHSILNEIIQKILHSAHTHTIVKLVFLLESDTPVFMVYHHDTMVRTNIYIAVEIVSLISLKHSMIQLNTCSRLEPIR